MPDGLDGLAMRVKVIYQDDNGVLETVFSEPTGGGRDAALSPPAAPSAQESPTDSPDGGVHFIRSDLQFILDQIVIAERHAAGEDLLDILPNSRLALRPAHGRRLVQQPGAGSGRTSAPRTRTSRSLLDQVFRNDLDGDTFDANGPAPEERSRDNTNYAANGDVVDADPRIISNLIVDQTPNNPAAIAAALAAAGSEDIEGDTVAVLDACRPILNAATGRRSSGARRRSTRSSRDWGSRS